MSFLCCPECGLNLTPNMKYGKRMCQICGYNIRGVWKKYEDQQAQLKAAEEEEKRRVENERQKILFAEKQRRAKRDRKRLAVAIVFGVILIISASVLKITVRSKVNNLIDLENAYNGLLPIGSKTSSGGTVIYDKGNYEGGWRYLECSEPFAKDAVWAIGNLGDNIDIFSLDIGTGDVNTWKIINLKGMDSAAGLAFKYGDGINGWYLPNIEEGKLISNVANIKVSFWCSSGKNDYASIIKDGKDDVVPVAEYYELTNSPKPSGIYVVAVRKF